MINLNEQLLMSIDNIETAISESELNVCMEMVSGYSKMYTILEYASEDIDTSGLDIFTESDTNQPEEQTDQSDDKKDDKKKKYKGIGGFFKRIGHALKALGKFIVSQFRSTTKIVRNLFIDDTYRTSFKFNSENKRKYTDMSMEGIPPFEPINKNGEQQSSPEPNEQIHEIGLVSPLDVYVMLCIFIGVVKGLQFRTQATTESKEYKGVMFMASMGDVETFHIKLKGTAKEILIKLNNSIKYENLRKNQQKYFQNYDMSRLSLYNVILDSSKLVNELGDEFEKLGDSTAVSEKTKQEIGTAIMNIKKYDVENVGAVTKITNLAQNEKASKG